MSEETKELADLTFLQDAGMRSNFYQQCTSFFHLKIERFEETRTLHYHRQLIDNIFRETENNQ